MKIKENIGDLGTLLNGEVHFSSLNLHVFFNWAFDEFDSHIYFES